MNLTLHLTDNCNMACRYCFECTGNRRMSRETAVAAVDFLLTQNQSHNGFSFFGGEPLLEKALIEKVVMYTAQKTALTGCTFEYKITTNGTLFDEAFLQLCDRHGIEIAFSHDGAMQDDMRIMRTGEGSAALLEDKIDLLLAHQQRCVVMLTVTKQTAHKLFDSVKWLYDRGFSRINSVIDYRRSADWDNKSLAIIGKQYEKIADFVFSKAKENRPLAFLPFDSKVKMYMRGESYCDNLCRLGKKQLSVAPDGSFYPCIQFLDIPFYKLGDVYSGVNKEKQEEIFRLGSVPVKSCVDCELKDRCRHNCSCLNMQLTGKVNEVSPIQCAHERIIIPIADRLAERLFDCGMLNTKMDE